MNWGWQVGLACLVAGLVEMVLHWFPWRLALRKDLPRVAAYVLGVAGFSIPLGVLEGVWISQAPTDSTAHLVALVMVIVSSGVAVMTAYGLDRVFGVMANLWDDSEHLRRVRDGRIAEADES